LEGLTPGKEAFLFFAFQLVDLPGFLANPLPGQPDNIGLQIIDIVDKYIKK
jgi:hypothetical protein